jgi:hypothetical protein
LINSSYRSRRKEEVVLVTALIELIVMVDETKDALFHKYAFRLISPHQSEFEGIFPVLDFGKVG